MAEPIQWTAQPLGEDATHSRERFRTARLEETLELYTQFFDAFVPIFDRLIDQIEQLAEHELDPEVLAEVMGDDDTKMAFRYLTAPPISEDDLKTLADAKLSPTALRREPESARRVRDTVLHILDPKRFPWIAEGRYPRDAEREVEGSQPRAKSTERRGRATDRDLSPPSPCQRARSICRRPERVHPAKRQSHRPASSPLRNALA